MAATPVLVLDAMVSKEDLASAEEMGEILERVGAVVITNAAPLELMDALDAQLEEAQAHQAQGSQPVALVSFLPGPRR